MPPLENGKKVALLLLQFISGTTHILEALEVFLDEHAYD